MLKVGQMRMDIVMCRIAVPTVEKLLRYEFDLPDDGLMVWHRPKRNTVIVVLRRRDHIKTF